MRAFALGHRTIASIAPTANYAALNPDANGLMWVVQAGGDIVQIPYYLTGILSARPAAAAKNAGMFYYATDAHTFTLSNGSAWILAPVGGTLLRRSVVAASGDYITGDGTNYMDVWAWGGGGGSGGAAGSGAIGSGSGGGAAGSKCFRRYAALPNHTYTSAISIGAAGAAGTAGNNDGGDGGDTTFYDGSTTIAAKGGKGGKGAAGSATGTNKFVAGGAGVIATGGDINGAGAPGSPGASGAGDQAQNMGGAGGSSEWGAGGAATVATGVGSFSGNPGIGYASGGGGSATYAGADTAGGVGTQGLVVVEERS